MSKKKEQDSSVKKKAITPLKPQRLIMKKRFDLGDHSSDQNQCNQPTQKPVPRSFIPYNNPFSKQDINQYGGCNGILQTQQPEQKHMLTQEDITSPTKSSGRAEDEQDRKNAQNVAKLTIPKIRASKS